MTAEGFLFGLLMDNVTESTIEQLAPLYSQPRYPHGSGCIKIKQNDVILYFRNSFFFISFSWWIFHLKFVNNSVNNCRHFQLNSNPELLSIAYKTFSCICSFELNAGSFNKFMHVLADGKRSVSPAFWIQNGGSKSWIEKKHIGNWMNCCLAW